MAPDVLKHFMRRFTFTRVVGYPLSSKNVQQIRTEVPTIPGDVKVHPSWNTKEIE